MKQTNIAVATASGRVFYRLISELKTRKIPFIVIKPSEVIPLSVTVTITTESEKNGVHCPNVLTYDGLDDPSAIVGEALQIARGKQRYDSLVVGVDPGKDFGVAAIGDGVILKAESASCEEDAAGEVLRIMERFEGRKRVVKVGNGAHAYGMRLIRILDRRLSPDVDIELVEERGTTKSVNIFSYISSKDTASALMISLRKGLKFARENTWKDS